jgi:hypothetical protein
MITQILALLLYRETLFLRTQKSRIQDNKTLNQLHSRITKNYNLSIYPQINLITWSD